MDPVFFANSNGHEIIKNNRHYTVRRSSDSNVYKYMIVQPLGCIDNTFGLEVIGGHGAVF